jgi:hypothetical protein
MTPLRRYTFKAARDDYEALLKRFDNRPISLSLILATAVLAGLGWGAVDPGWFGELALLPVIAAAALILFGFAHLWRRVRRARRVARWRAPHEPTEVLEWRDHLLVRGNGGARRYAFNEIRDVSMDEARVYIVKSRDEFVIMPLVAFESRADMRAFALACEKRMRAPANEDASETNETGAAASSLPSPAPASAPACAQSAREGVDVALSQDDAIAVEAALRQPVGATTSLAAASLATGLAGGFAAGAAAWAVTSGLEPGDRALAGAVAAWAGAIVLTFLGARRIEGARAAPWPAQDQRRMTLRIEIDGAGLVSRGADFETRIAWTGVEAIRETEQHILFITRWKETYAVPKRCFADADECQIFANRARAFKTAS